MQPEPEWALPSQASPAAASCPYTIYMNFQCASDHHRMPAGHAKSLHEESANLQMEAASSSRLQHSKAKEAPAHLTQGQSIPFAAH